LLQTSFVGSTGNASLMASAHSDSCFRT
jgi:hypothetical protein